MRRTAALSLDSIIIAKEGAAAQNYYTSERAKERDSIKRAIPRCDAVRATLSQCKFHSLLYLVIKGNALN